MEDNTNTIPATDPVVTPVNNEPSAPVDPNLPADPSTETTTTPENGQDDPGDANADDPILAIATKKGWDAKQAPGLLAKAYSELESKLGNYKEVEKRAALYEEAQKKAELWDSAQRYLETQDENGTPDLTKLNTTDLAALWENGQIGLADMPADKQAEVLRFVNTSHTTQEAVVTKQAQDLIENNPVLKDPRALEFVATKIEQGMEPDEAIGMVNAIIADAERKAEERHKKDTEMIRNGNLEPSGSPATTAPKREIKTVQDAFRAAKEEIDARKN